MWAFRSGRREAVERHLSHAIGRQCLYADRLRASIQEIRERVRVNMGRLGSGEHLIKLALDHAVRHFFRCGFFSEKHGVSHPLQDVLK
jgi:hypothetical protein